VPKDSSAKFKSLNKGEWSEVYTFLKLCVERYMPLADADLNAKDYGFKILQASLADLNIVYDLTKSGYIEKLNTNNTNKLDVFKTSEIDLEKIFVELLEAKGSSFEIESLNVPIKLFGLEKMKSSSKKKKDIDLLIENTKDSKEFSSGFSIKSKLGQPSTLLNASQATNFIFKLDSFQGDVSKINSIKNSKKIKERLEASISKCKKLLFDKTNSLILENNLKKIDTNLPKIVAEMLLSYFYRGNKTLNDITADLCEGDLCKQLGLGYEDLKYIFTKFLIAIALGMFPKSEWDGYYEADGCIVLKQTGDIVCLHILEKKELGEYLFKNTYLDTPSSTRHKFGEVYKLDDEYFFNLNLQIRFNN
jgi:hypothetical protein